MNTDETRIFCEPELSVIPSRADGKREPALSEANVDLAYAKMVCDKHHA